MVFNIFIIFLIKETYLLKILSVVFDPTDTLQPQSKVNLVFLRM